MLAVLFLTWWWVRRRSRPTAPPPEVIVGDYSRPPEAYAALATRLADQGVARRSGETIEAFAHRTGGPVGDALRRYADWRYGGQGSAAEICRELDTLGHP